MGMVDFSIGGSDAAAGFVFTVAEEITKLCKKEMKKSSNSYNTSGFENVALLLTSIINEDNIYEFVSEDMLNVVSECYSKYLENKKEFIKASGKMNHSFVKDYKDTFKQLKAIKKKMEYLYV